MEIGIRYKIESNAKNVILYEKVKRKRLITGETYEDWREMGYYATLEGALKELAEMKLRETELKDVKTIVCKQDEIYKLIDSIRINSLKPLDK